MRIYKSIQSYHPDPNAPLVVGLGNFDGLHLGHQALMKTAVTIAKEKKSTAAVFTFQKHPQEVLHHGERARLLTSMDYKLRLLSSFYKRIFRNYRAEICEKYSGRKTLS